MSFPSVPLVIPRFDNTLGSLLVGGLLAMALWGVTCVQTYNYFTRTNKDRSFLKIMVGILWGLDTFDSALNGHILYFYMVSNYLNPLAIFKPVWSILIHVAVTSISNFMIRTMFTVRVFKLSRRNFLLTGWIMALSLSDLVVGITITIKAFKITSFPELSKIANLMYLTFAVGTGSDLCLALALSWLLYGSRTGFRRTDSLIKILMLYTVNTGMIVAIDASMGLILYAIMPNNFIFLGFYLLLSKLYVNAYLASLNARETLRDNKDDMLSIHLSDIPHSQRFDVESTLPAEKSTGSKTESGKMAVSFQTLVSKRFESEITSSEQFPRAI
ncbi:hypothetical protein GALMADRAFT_255074 [Galerina marginata CBS 339.88]|uniref:DUF6534 domain-containing protein n=1 Tax=Galerina marginata (strain CBS 339.88) TaxID=685588 RepID=A0A067SR78_GALM3|nr:hypothetical protein GALMADRAFT_255074 [Galerina marginata CBS 339.88]